MTAFRMYLRIVSATLQPEEISQRLGVDPDESERIGNRRHPQSPKFVESRWIRRARTPGNGARPEDLAPVVVHWGMEFALSVGQLVRSGEASASLEIVQEIRDLDSAEEKGIFLSPELCAWLAAAEASLDIDQYIYHGCPMGWDSDSLP